MNVGAFFTKMAHSLLVAAIMALPLAGCGYQWQGSENASASSVLGVGVSTVKIVGVEQSSLYPWVPYYLRSLMRDEITLRRLAKWQDDGEADYTLEMRMPSFSVSSYVSNTEDITLINAATVYLEVIVYEGGSGAVAWRSGLVGYSDHFENQREHVAIRELLREVVRRTVDRMQLRF